jgi:hypothetical protein
MQRPSRGMAPFWVHCGDDWATSSKWEVQRYLFNTNEAEVGTLVFQGQERVVFRCLNDEEFVFMVYPQDRISKDPYFLKFEGKNWRLSGDRKWKKCEPVECGKPVGSKEINGVRYEVFSFNEFFIAREILGEEQS